MSSRKLHSGEHPRKIIYIMCNFSLTRITFRVIIPTTAATRSFSAPPRSAPCPSGRGFSSHGHKHRISDTGHDGRPESTPYFGTVGEPHGEAAEGEALFNHNERRRDNRSEYKADRAATAEGICDLVHHSGSRPVMPSRARRLRPRIPCFLLPPSRFGMRPRLRRNLRAAKCRGGNRPDFSTWMARTILLEITGRRPLAR